MAAAWSVFEILDELSPKVERNNTAAVGHIEFDTDIAVDVVVTELVDRHTDSF